MITKLHVRPAIRADLPRIYKVRHGTEENRLTDPALVTEAEVVWYMDKAIFLVSEDQSGVQGFVCANDQTGYVWALFVIEESQGRGHGSGLLDAAMSRLRERGHRQAFLTTGAGTRAAEFYRSRGWQPMGANLGEEMVFRRWL
jgi:GNAT superfamily N-acetyltransferase